ncbi:alpha/beta fold hydrolase [Leifsonia shinshuensis]|uniref:3-oxoadipate enol-lactonase/4-carboxymuconolactone decarboxylase n=1 Tax=Leifsonia shinshuensis TaxID=150026 RepID=A0A853D4K1_9MICO|nr:3-oxoadipate enol-lactonase/4-carboxymuconolactone decarboxylase [Leifsonia shinshuensis]
MTVPRLRGSMTAASPSAATSRLLVLLPSLGTTTELWDGVVARLSGAAGSPRILRVDVPGHGASPATHEPFTMAELAQGVLALVDEVGGGAFDVAGDSLGGAIALEVALAAPERVRSLAMFCSGARIGTPEGWADRAAQVRASGTASVVAGSAQRWFAPGYLDAHPDGPGGRALRTLLDVDDESYALCCEALGGFDRRDVLAGVRTPALIVAGSHDQVATSASMAELAAALPDARFVDLAHAGHLVPLEDPAETAALLTALFARTGDTAEREPVAARGMRVRRAVLGDAHVDRATAAITPETADFQDFITRYAWGEVWARPQLTRQQRSIATLASLVTGGHENELRMHIRAALRNGLTRTEIAEVIHHTALYAGLPAANGALAIMRDIFTEETDG